MTWTLVAQTQETCGRDQGRQGGGDGSSFVATNGHAGLYLPGNMTATPGARRAAETQ